MRPLDLQDLGTPHTKDLKAKKVRVYPSSDS